MVTEFLGTLTEIERSHLIGLDPLQEEVALVACEEPMGGHNEADIHT